MSQPVSHQPGPTGGANRKKSVFRRRAADLARPAARKDETGAFLDLVEFHLASERYAFESLHVREVYPLHQLAPVPCTPPFILGIINVRGRILAVVDLKKFFDLPTRGLGDLNKVIILQSGDMEMGILADRVAGTRILRLDELQPALPTLTGIRENYLKGIGPGQLVVLDAARILADKQIIIHEEVARV